MKTKATYDEAFARERLNEYPELSAFEAACGFAVPRIKLEEAARVLACPVKINPPNWQHGRVIYAKARQMIASGARGSVLVDIGTAKGFSACVLGWAVEDGGAADLSVHSVDVISPAAKVLRNSVAELEEPLDISQFVAPFISDQTDTTFYDGGSENMLRSLAATNSLVMLAFVDGKHTFAAVKREAELLTDMQERGGVIIFDDCQMDQVHRAVNSMSGKGYSSQILKAGQRVYAVATRL